MDCVIFIAHVLNHYGLRWVIKLYSFILYSIFDSGFALGMLGRSPCRQASANALMGRAIAV